MRWAGGITEPFTFQASVTIVTGEARALGRTFNLERKSKCRKVKCNRTPITKAGSISSVYFAGWAVDFF